MFYNNVLKLGLEKIAGGPGSGVSRNNTRKIGLPMSEHISVGTRTRKTEGVKSRTGVVPMSKIKKVCQEKYVTKKLNKMTKNFDKWNLGDKPIDILKVKDNEFHVIDGHHRYLSAKANNKRQLKANIYNAKELNE